MGIAGKELVSLALELWNGFFDRKVRDTQQGMVRYYRAQVTAADFLDPEEKRAMLGLASRENSR